MITYQTLLNDAPYVSDTVLVTFMQGHLLKQKTAKDTSGIATLDVSSLQSGNYIVKVGNYSKQITIVK